MVEVIRSYMQVMLHAWGRKKYRILFGNLEGRGQKDIGVVGGIILKWILRK
jgi:hypothetical protein